MAKAKKRPTKSSARKKPAAKKSAAAKKSSAKPAAPPKKVATKKAAPKSKSSNAKKAVAQSSAAKPASKPVERVLVKPQRPEPAPKKAAPQDNLPPDTKKKLAAQHMWDLVQAKRQRAAQTPAWKAIEHHDHPAPRTSPDLSSDQGGSSMPPEMPGHRDRGTG
jgi:hypothetical protein